MHAQLALAADVARCVAAPQVRYYFASRTTPLKLGPLGASPAKFAMNADHARTLIAYNGWANRRLLEACRRLTSDELTRDAGSSWQSVRGTLVHIVHGEWKWFNFFRGQPYDLPLDPEQFADVASLEARHSEIEDDQVQFAAGLTDQHMQTTSIVREREQTLAHMLHHILNHSSYHRGQVVTLLRQMGQTPPSTDFMRYLEQLS